MLMNGSKNQIISCFPPYPLHLFQLCPSNFVLPLLDLFLIYPGVRGALAPHLYVFIGIDNKKYHQKIEC